MYTSMTTEALQTEQTHLHGEGKALKQRKRALDAELQARSVRDAAVSKLAAMSPAERAVAAQLIGRAGAIQSSETIGTPGAN